MLVYRLKEDAELRFLEEFHADELFALIDHNRLHLRRWLPFVDAQVTPSQSLEFIRMARQQWVNQQGTHYGIFYKGQLAGVIGYHFIDWSNRATSIGYWLGEAYQGNGLMTLSTRALVDQAFYQWNLNRVEIRAATGNFRSQAVPERLGFTKEGIIRQREWLYDHYVDHISYSMLASEWK